MFWKSLVPMALVCCIALTLGCSNKANTEAMIRDKNKTTIAKLATLYSMFQTRNGLRGPADEAEFKKFIGEQDASRLEMVDIDITDIDSLFVSDRDSQPFKIRYKIDTFVGAPSRPVIFEAEGVGGKRMVAFTANGIAPKEVDSSEYDSLWNGDADNATEEMNRGGRG